MHSENMFIQQQNEILRLQQENDILKTALLNACQIICRDMNYSKEEIIKLKQKFINRVKENYERACSDE